jgi:serine/threonine protein kinase
LKPENVLCLGDPSTGEFGVKVADLGMSKVLVQGLKQSLEYCGTPLYNSPEMHRKEAYSYPTDVWSIGIMMHELLCGKPPFHGNNIKELQNDIFTYTGLVGSDMSIPALRIKRQWQNKVDTGAQSLIALFLVPDPSGRITAADALNHKWLAKVEELSDEPRVDIAINLQISTDKRKFKRTVNKIVLAQKIFRAVKESSVYNVHVAPLTAEQEAMLDERNKAAPPPTTGELHATSSQVHKKKGDEGGEFTCKCVIA